MQSQRVDELAITLQNNNMNLETRQAWKYVSLRLPGLWPLMSPLTLLANGGLVFMTVDT